MNESYVGKIIREKGLSIDMISDKLGLNPQMVEDFTKKSKLYMMETYKLSDHNYEKFVNKIRIFNIDINDEEKTSEVNQSTEIKNQENNNPILQQYIDELNKLSNISLYKIFDLSRWNIKFMKMITYILKDIKELCKSYTEMEAYLSIKKPNNWISNAFSSDSLYLTYNDVKTILKESESENLIKYPCMSNFHNELKTILKKNNIDEKTFIEDFIQYCKDFYYNKNNSRRGAHNVYNNMKDVLDDYNVVILRKTHEILLKYLVEKQYITISNTLEEKDMAKGKYKSKNKRTSLENSLHMAKMNDQTVKNQMITENINNYKKDNKDNSDTTNKVYDITNPDLITTINKEIIDMKGKEYLDFATLCTKLSETSIHELYEHAKKLKEKEDKIRNERLDNAVNTIASLLNNGDVDMRSFIDKLNDKVRIMDIKSTNVEN